MTVEFKNKINQLKFIKTIFVYKHPLLNFFEDEKENIYLVCWYDMDESYDKWALLKIENENLEDYKSNKISLFEIFIQNESFLVFDTKHSNFEKIEWKNISEMKLKNFDCLPEKDAYLILNEDLENAH